MTYEDRQRIAKDYHRYRQAAARLTGHAVPSMANVQEDADRTGAFVEVMIWVSREEIERNESAQVLPNVALPHDVRNRLQRCADKGHKWQVDVERPISEIDVVKVCCFNCEWSWRSNVLEAK